MILINFLPWREEVRKKQKMFFLFVCAVIVAVALICIALIHIFISTNIAYQEERITFLKDNIQYIGNKIRDVNNAKERREELIDRMKTMQAIQIERFLAVRIFDELVEVIPPGVHLEKVSLKKDGLHLEGVVESNARVSELMTNIDKSKWFSRPVLSEISKKSETQGGERIFKLRLIPSVSVSSEPETSLETEEEVQSGS